LVVAAAALESGDYTADSELDNPATLQLPGSDSIVSNWNRGQCPGAGDTVTLRQALRESCNIPFAELGLALGRQALLEQAKKFGFNSSFEIPMRTAESNFPTVMDDPQTMLASFGQFDVRATPLQVAMVSAAIANGGKVMSPSLISSILDPTLASLFDFQPTQYSQAISVDTAAALTAMMVDGVDNGLAGDARISGIQVAGKTGTAENGIGEPYTFWFTGFAPADNPRYAITVLVEDGGGMGQQGYGNLVAAPIARHVLEAVLFQ
jgi:peptidoglycan glycosyltransferase